MVFMDKKKKETPIIVQCGIYAIILFVAQLISSLFPASFSVPAPLIGMILLYILLSTHVIKLHQVEKLGDFMLGLIAFLFVPSGIQLAGSMQLMKTEGVKDIVVSIIATLILLIIICFIEAALIRLHARLAKSTK
ncbi:LrgA family protein [Limosilactobacillus oris F0423]|uniref:LrgA family protein n=1 Tax=Limosilactobacillus oris F0423 TaxID=944562 RepID=A0ABN0D776_9LACO|nr:CidA/LrgA family protein [Limosilactobacillus oris]EGS38755.1 LrgA family protein [Limosilactobacillus oris F0423]